MLRYDIPPTEEQEAPYIEEDITQPPLEIVYLTMSTRDPEHHIHWREVGNIVVACMAIAIMLPFVLSPDTAMYVTKTLTVPAILLPLRIITVSVPIKSTGVKTYPALQAHGTLTITNGGTLSQYIQPGFLFTSNSGVEVSTNYGVTVPAGNGESYGVAIVSAHAVVAGSSGDIPAYDVNRTYGTDIFIKNTSAFVGGQNAYSVGYATEQDKQTALDSAKAQIETKQPLVMLLKPCTETTKLRKDTAVAILTCQPITYHVPPGVKVLSVSVRGTNVVITYRVRINTPM